MDPRFRGDDYVFGADLCIEAQNFSSPAVQEGDPSHPAPPRPVLPVRLLVTLH